MRCTGSAIFVFVVTLAATAVFGDDESRRIQVNAATADAANLLRREILDVHLAVNLTVEQFLDRLHARHRLDTLLQTAQQIGGARWLDGQTFQVRLEIDGDSVANLLETIALQHPQNQPLPFQILRARLKAEFVRHIYAATGTTTAGSAA